MNRFVKYGLTIFNIDHIVKARIVVTIDDELSIYVNITLTSSPEEISLYFQDKVSAQQFLDEIYTV